MRDRPTLCCAALVCSLAVFTATPVLTQPRAPRAAIPLEPVAAIVHAFRSYRVVAIGETHGNEQHHVFLRALIRDPRFTATVNDIVVEFGNARYQDVIDRFIRGEEVPDASLRRVWQYTPVGMGSWNAPMYEGFYRDVRALNASLPRERQLRVLLGDPPVDWEQPDLGGWVRKGNGVGVEWPTGDERYDRNFHAASVIAREVLPKRRRALVLYGFHHVFHGNLSSIVGILENRFATKVFSIVAPTGHALERVQSDIPSWEVPSLTLLRGTRLGLLDSTFVLNAPLSENSAENNFDALLYLGRSGSLTSSSP